MQDTLATFKTNKLELPHAAMPWISMSLFIDSSNEQFEGCFICNKNSDKLHYDSNEDEFICETCKEIQEYSSEDSDQDEDKGMQNQMHKK